MGVVVVGFHWIGDGIDSLFVLHFWSEDSC